MEEKRNNPVRLGLFFLILLVLEVLWGIIALKTSLITCANKNIIYFASAVIFAFVSYIIYEIAMPQFGEVKKNKRKQNLMGDCVFLLMSIIVLVIFVHPYIINTFSLYYPNSISGRLAYVLTDLLIVGIVFFIYKKNLQLPAKINRKLLYLFYVLLAGCTIYSLCRYNVFAGDLYHFDAYYHSVYRASMLQPYSEVNTGIYGFYGILLMPITKIIGSSFIRMIIFLAFLTGISLFCYFYVLDNMVSNTWVKLLTTVSLSSFVVWERPGLYFQVFPHRILFPGLILAYITWCTRHNKEGILYKTVGFLICTLSIVWNMETGLATLLAYTGSNIVRCCQKYKVTEKGFWITVLKEIFIMPISFSAAYLIVGIYNILTGGTFLPIDVFMFPLIGSETGYMEWLTMELPVKLSPWMGCLALILACVVLVLRNCFFKREKNGRIILLSGCTIAVAIQMVYYVNRPSVLLLYIVMPVMGIIMGWMAEYLYHVCNKKDAISSIAHALYVWLTAILFMMAIIFPIRFIPQQIMYAQQRNTEELDKLTENVKETIPPDTVGFGEGIDEIYSRLGWKTGYYGIDMPDYTMANEVSLEYLFDLINRSDSLFVNDDSLNTISYYYGNNTWKDEVFLQEFTCVADLYYGDNQELNYRYYVRKK